MPQPSPGGNSASCWSARSRRSARGVVPDVVGEVLDVVRQAAGVLEEPADGDAAAVDALPADEARQVGLDRGVEADPSLGCELQDEHRGERLGVAADPHLSVPGHLRAGGEVADARGMGAGAAVAVLDARQGRRDAVGGHERAQALPDGVRPRGGRRGGLRDSGGRQGRDGHQGRGRQGSAAGRLAAASTDGDSVLPARARASSYGYGDGARDGTSLRGLPVATGSTGPSISIGGGPERSRCPVGPRWG
ncbi:hypothetical protein SALBM135S_07019 [Streptomyces alboniger]